MKKIKKILISFLVTFVLGTGTVLAISQFPIAPALFDSSLASPQLTTDTTLTMATAPNIYPSDYVCVAVDSNLTTLEYECGTASSTPTVLVNLTRGLNFRDATTTVTANTFSHRAGADVRITTFPILTQMANQLNGNQGFPKIISYSSTSTISTSTLQIPYAAWTDSDAQYWATIASTSAENTLLGGSFTYSGANTYSGNNSITGTPTFSNGASFTTVAPTDSVTPVSATQIANKSYVDGVAIQGSPTATLTATGTVKIANNTQAASSTALSSSGAYLALTSSISTSTSQVATSSVVVTNQYGKLDSSFFGTTTVSTASPFTFATSSITIGAFPAYNIGKNVQVFTSSGTFIVPSGVNTVYVRLIGGGGGSGGDNTGSGVASPGAGAGGYAEGPVNVSATSSVFVGVGVGGFGGAGGGSPQNGGTGSTTMFSTFMSATGGSGSFAGQNTPETGSSGGGSVGGAVSISGGNGYTSFSVTASGAPSGSAYSVAGVGGSSEFGGQGAAGSGANGVTGASTAGSAGLAGIVIINW